MAKPFSMAKDALRAFPCSPAFVPLCLLVVSILAYGLLIPWLHLYIDDWIWFWTWEKFGRAGLVRYFSTNRPVWGAIYQITLPLLTQSIIGSHLFALLARWLCSLVFWWLLKMLWPNRLLTAFSGALFFLIYPGFVLQSIALTYGHIFLIYSAFILSLCFSLLAQQQPKRFWVFTAGAALLSLLNLLTVEFFFTLELSRLLVLLIGQDQKQVWPHRFRRVLIAWLPYVAILVMVTIWRIFFFRYQTYNHAITFFPEFKMNPGATILHLVQTILQDVFASTIGSWLPAVGRLMGMNFYLGNSLATLLVCAVAAGGVALSLFLFLRSGSAQEPMPASSRRWLWQVGGLGLGCLLAAGWPFWLTGLDVRPEQFNSRLTIPFILGATLVGCVLLELLPKMWLRCGVIAVLVALSCGYHFQIANDFRLDWQNNRQLMWQIAWRIPALKPGTTLLITDFPTTYYNTAALSTELNAIYPNPGEPNELAYYILYSREMERDLPGGLAPGQPVRGSNVTARFEGSTDQLLALQYDGGRCLRLLDPVFDPADETLPEHLRKAARISNLDWVLLNQPAAVPPQRWFGSEPAKQWCYYFEKADLARQEGDWVMAAKLGEEAWRANLQPKDELEKLVFIEAFARVGQWDHAVKITRGFQNNEKLPMLCKTWQRIIADSISPAAQKKAEEALSQTGRCK